MRKLTSRMDPMGFLYLLYITYLAQFLLTIAESSTRPSGWGSLSSVGIRRVGGTVEVSWRSRAAVSSWQGGGVGDPEPGTYIAFHAPYLYKYRAKLHDALRMFWLFWKFLGWFLFQDRLQLETFCILAGLTVEVNFQLQCKSTVLTKGVILPFMTRDCLGEPLYYEQLSQREGESADTVDGRTPQRPPGIYFKTHVNNGISITNPQLVIRRIFVHQNSVIFGVQVTSRAPSCHDWWNFVRWCVASYRILRSWFAVGRFVQQGFGWKNARTADGWKLLRFFSVVFKGGWIVFFQKVSISEKVSYSSYFIVCVLEWQLWNRCLLKGKKGFFSISSRYFRSHLLHA